MTSWILQDKKGGDAADVYTLKHTKVGLIVSGVIICAFVLSEMEQSLSGTESSTDKKVLDPNKCPFHFTTR